MSKDISKFLKIKIEVHDNFNIGPGKIALMESIISCGSISSAAKKMGMSYRKAWKLVKEINNASNKILEPEASVNDVRKKIFDLFK